MIFSVVGIIATPYILNIIKKGGVSMTESEATIIGEFKSTQNLLLPVTAAELVEKYQRAYNEVICEGKERTGVFNLFI